MVLHGEEIKTPQKKKISEGIMYLDVVTQINPDNWAAFWLKGKGYQALNDSSSAYNEFNASYSIQKENPDVARELMFECTAIPQNRAVGCRNGWSRALSG